MSLHFAKVAVKEIKKETNECVSVTFEIPQNLIHQFSYKQGQHLTLRTFINGEEVRRSYSLCSSPLENEWRIAIKKTEGGLFSTFANDVLQPGDELDVMPPMGKFFTEIHAANKKHYAAIAAGSGITPVISIIKTVLATEQHSSFTLLYGNKNRNSVIFREKLEALKNKYISRFRIIHVLSREMTDAPINHGRIDAEKCKQVFGKLISLGADEYFICGPEAMIFTVKDFLQQSGVNEKKIHFELFTSSGTKKHRHVIAATTGSNTPVCKIAIKLDGVSFNFDLPFNSNNILDAALQHGADLPYSCKGGVCCSCKAKLTEGEVQMDVHYALEPEEIEEGYILTCQSYPKTEKVVIDFDMR